MSFTNQFSADIAAILSDENGPSETIVYRTADGAEKSFRAIVERLGRGESSFSDGMSDQEAVVVHVSAADVPVVSLEDEIGIVPTGSATLEWWSILRVRNDSGALRELEAVRSTRTRLANELTEWDRTRGVSFSR